MNIQLICPLCGRDLKRNDPTWYCEGNHSFDIARQGYVNLLPVQNKKSLHPGDTKEMLAARRIFLNQGHYLPIEESVIRAIQQYCQKGTPVLADIGCGEGYYTVSFEKACHAECVGIDIAKDGVRMACARSRTVTWLVATASRLPLKDGSVDCVTAMFSLFLPQEYARVLKQGGCVIEVTAGEDHLRELKSIIYEEVFEQHKHLPNCGSELTEAECREYRFPLTLSDSELQTLLMMTPHFWRIKKERREALSAVSQLTVTVHYRVRVMKKK